MFQIFKKIKKNKKKNQKGMTLIIALTTMTLLLSISLSISNIVLRQIRITNLNNSSKPAFFIADSGIECVFYYDTTKLDTGQIYLLNNEFETSVFGKLPVEDISSILKCGNGDVLGLTKETILLVPETILTTFDIDYGEMCARVNVTRTEVSTRITSYGYNTDSGPAGCNLSDKDLKRIVERGLTVKY